MPKLSCIAPLPQHLDVANQSLNAVHVAVPKVTGRNEKSVCGVQSIHKHTTQPLKSDSALKKSNFVKQHRKRGVEGRAGMVGLLCMLGRPWSFSASPSCTRDPRTPPFTKDHYFTKTDAKQHSCSAKQAVSRSVGSLHEG